MEKFLNLFGRFKVPKNFHFLQKKTFQFSPHFCFPMKTLCWVIYISNKPGSSVHVLYFSQHAISEFLLYLDDVMRAFKKIRDLVILNWTGNVWEKCIERKECQVAMGLFWTLDRWSGNLLCWPLGHPTPPIKKSLTLCYASSVK